MAQTGRGGMGSHKHGTSGRVPPTPGYKMQRTREANALAEAERAKRPVAPTYATVADAMKARRRGR
jgi:hypothetical protein